MKYTLIKSFKENDGGQLVATYGIGCGECSITDVSCDEYAIRQLVSDCNRYRLDPVHLNDVVQDFINA